MSQGFVNQTTVSDASDTEKGIIEIAVQSEMEAGSSNTLAVTPGRQHYHVSAAKGWVLYDQIAVNIDASYNVTSVTDTSAGLYEVVWDTDFSSANYSAHVTTNQNEGSANGASALAAGITKGFAATSTGTLTDAAINCVTVFGDQ